MQMGTVPHIFAVVRPKGTFYNMTFFYRENIYPYSPSSPPYDFCFERDGYLKDYLLTKLHNGVCVTRQVPPMNKLYIRPKEQYIKELGEKWSVKRETDVEPVSTSKLVVHCISGSDLIAKDSNGLSDPFLVVHFANQKLKTGVIDKTLNPAWNENLEFDMGNVDMNTEIQCIVYDKDPMKVDYMGEFSLLLREAVDLKGAPKTFNLVTHKKNKKATGNVTLSFNVTN